MICSEAAIRKPYASLEYTTLTRFSRIIVYFTSLKFKYDDSFMATRARAHLRREEANPG